MFWLVFFTQILYLTHIPNVIWRAVRRLIIANDISNTIHTLYTTLEIMDTLRFFPLKICKYYWKLKRKDLFILKIFLRTNKNSFYFSEGLKERNLVSCKFVWHWDCHWNKLLALYRILSPRIINTEPSQYVRNPLIHINPLCRGLLWRRPWEFASSF